MSDPESELILGRWVTGGVCLAHADGQTWLVRFGIPGERVRVAVTRRARGVVYADVIEVLAASPERTDPPCRYFGPGLCGGCDLQHVALDEQRRAKRAVVLDCLVRLGGVDREDAEARTSETSWIPTVESGLRWRTRMSAVRVTDGIGMRRARSHALIDVTDCVITDEKVCTTVTRALEPGVEFRAALGSDGAVGVDYAGHASRVTESVRTARGTLAWSLPVGVFWQVHRGFPQFLGDTVIGLAETTSEDEWWDLFAGAGLLTAFLDGAGVSRVHSVESDPRASKAARRTFHDRPGVILHTAEVEAWLGTQSRPPDGVVVDPPRRGCGPRVIGTLVSLRVPKIVYVACDPAAFARDIRELRAGGYRLIRVIPIDAFPMTQHVETVALLVHGDR